MDKEALKRTALMADIVTLVEELQAIHHSEVENWHTLTPSEKHRSHQQLEWVLNVEGA